MPITRPARPSDLETLAHLRHSLWPEGTTIEHQRELEAIVTGAWSGQSPYVVFVTEGEDGRPAGFAEVTLRSHADGCDPSRPVGYLEGWYVEEPRRRTGHGAALLRAAEAWARAEGAREMASDTWIDSELSQSVHEALGFEVVDRVVTYRKKI
ncbi:MAG: GNAT family N-acetyltransferase [Thermoanaerobaculia bacterium]